MTMEATLEGVRERPYLRVKGQIVERIAQLRPGVLIPPERDLAVVYSTSRTTVRKAVAELVAEGRLVRRQGSGTYVAEPKLAWPLTVNGFSGHAEPEVEGLRTSTTLLGSERIAATAELADRLGVRPGAEVLSMQFLRCVNDAPMALECVHVSGRRYPGLESEVAGSDPTYDVLRKKVSDRVAHAVESIETVPAAPARPRCSAPRSARRCCSSPGTATPSRASRWSGRRPGTGATGTRSWRTSPARPLPERCQQPEWCQQPERRGRRRRPGVDLGERRHPRRGRGPGF